MKLQQGQLWQCGDSTIRLVRLERLAVEYKTIADPESGESTHHRVSKKEFCLLIKNAAPLPSAG